MQERKDSQRKQLGLFGQEISHGPGRPARARSVGPASVPDSIRTLAEAVPREIRLGTSSWSYPGWTGIVYDRVASERVLARNGLHAYASHPLFRTVGIDRTFYAPIPASTFESYADKVPADFRFLVKAHEFCTTFRFTTHVRYGPRKGARNDCFLNPGYATTEVIAPIQEGLRSKAGPIVFQFMPQELQELGGSDVFLERLARFLDALPKGPLYAVEIRNRELLGEAYRAMLSQTGASHCFAGHPSMPSLRIQRETLGADPKRPIVIRWMLGSGLRYETALKLYEPFDRLVNPDSSAREDIRTICLSSLPLPAFVIINNKAEGSAPLSVLDLARDLALPQ